MGKLDVLALAGSSKSHACALTDTMLRLLDVQVEEMLAVLLLLQEL